jgi:hypothetical protein
VISRCPALRPLRGDGGEIVGPLHGPGAESGDGGVIEPIGDEGFVVGPLGACEVRLQILALEAATGVAAAELLEF